MNVPSAPARLQFRLRGFNENESTDDFLQGANDEVWMSAAGLDSSSVKVGPDHQPVADTVRTQPLGDVSDDAVRGPWKTQPHVLMEFDLRQPGDFPRTYTVTLFIVEHDNGDLQKAFEELEQRVGPQIKAAAVAAAVAAGTAVGAAVGSAVPGIGTAVGAAVGALAGLSYDGVVKAIDGGLADDVFTPIPVTLTVGNPSLLGQQPGVGTEQSLKVREHGADYDVIYDWNVVLAPTGQLTPKSAGGSVIAREPDHLDVFWVGPDGAIGSQWWHAGAGTSWGDHQPFPITPPGAARPGSPVAVVAREPDHLDVFWVGPDGAIGSQWWHAGAGTSWGDHQPFPITPPGAARPGSPVAVVAREPDHLDVFWVGPDGAIGSQWWHAGAGTSWGDHQPFPITPPGAARG